MTHYHLLLGISKYDSFCLWYISAKKLLTLYQNLISSKCLLTGIIKKNSLSTTVFPHWLIDLLTIRLK